MRIDPNALKRRRESLQAKGFGGARRGKVGYYDMKQPGIYTFFICPPTEAMDGVPSLPTLTHFNVGGERNHVHACLDPESPMFCGAWGKSLLAAIEMRNAQVMKDGKPDWAIRLPDPLECPSYDEDVERQERALGFVIPWGYRGVDDGPAEMRATSMSDRSKVLAWQPSPVMMDKVMGLIIKHGVALGDPEKAIFVEVTRTGKGFTDTKYEVTYDFDSRANPEPLPPYSVKALEQMLPGGLCDPFAVLAGGLRPIEQIREWLGLGGGQTGGSQSSDDDAGTEAPPCFNDGTTCDPAAKWCAPCPFLEECATTAGKSLGAAPEAPEPPAKAKPKAADKPKPAETASPPSDAKAAFLDSFKTEQ